MKFLFVAVLTLSVFPGYDARDAPLDQRKLGRSLHDYQVHEKRSDSLQEEQRYGSYEEPRYDSYEEEPRYDSYDEPRFDSYEEEPRYDSYEEEPRYESNEEARYESYEEEPRYDSYEEARYESYEEPRYDSYEEPRYGTIEERRYDSFEEEPRYDSYEEPRYDSFEEEPRNESYEEPRYDSYEEEPRNESYEEPRYDSYEEEPRYDSFDEEPRYDSYEEPRYESHEQKAGMRAENGLKHVTRHEDRSGNNEARFCSCLGSSQWSCSSKSGCWWNSFSRRCLGSCDGGGGGGGLFGGGGGSVPVTTCYPADCLGPPTKDICAEAFEELKATKTGLTSWDCKYAVKDKYPNVMCDSSPLIGPPTSCTVSHWSCGSIATGSTSTLSQAECTAVGCTYKAEYCITSGGFMISLMLSTIAVAVCTAFLI